MVGVVNGMINATQPTKFAVQRGLPSLVRPFTTVAWHFFLESSMRTKPPKCACGCGEDVNWKREGGWNTFLRGHYFHTEKSRLAASIRQTGVKNFLGRTHTKETKEKMAQSKIGENNPSWKGGRCKNTKGYIMLSVWNHPFSSKKGRLNEARIIMEKSLGRYLDSNEVVHHINGIKDDNRIENLQLMSVLQHSELHNRKRICTIATKKKMSISAKNKWERQKQNPVNMVKIRKKMSTAAKKRWADGKYKNRRAKRKVAQTNTNFGF